MSSLSPDPVQRIAAGQGTVRTRSGPATCVLALLGFVLLLTGCSDNGSILLYRLPYADGTQVCVGRDHLTHTPDTLRYDLGGTGGQTPYRVVAAQTGVVRLIQDSNTQNCCGGPSCGNNYVWIEHLGNEWTKYSHIETGSVRGDAGLSEGDVVVAGQFLGFESDVGRACSRCGSTDHLHFEVGVPTDPSNPVPNHDVAGAGGFIVGSNRRARFCNVQDGTLVEGRDETASRCNLILSCLRSVESPSTEGQCADRLSGPVCVREVNAGEQPLYQRGSDFSSDALKIDMDWCANASCDPQVTSGRAVELNITHTQGDVTSILLNCQNPRVSQAFQSVEQVSIRSHQGLPGNAACNGNTVAAAFARWEICEVPAQLLD